MYYDYKIVLIISRVCQTSMSLDCSIVNNPLFDWSCLGRKIQYWVNGNWTFLYKIEHINAMLMKIKIYNPVPVLAIDFFDTFLFCFLNSENSCIVLEIFLDVFQKSFRRLMYCIIFWFGLIIWSQSFCTNAHLIDIGFFFS